ncbi:iron ABC transporter substrate-binding protein [Bradyrhizobium manausense]|uniref:iron ABC transporter substrate-binding protein n=1 Tax=Bradyrhizobium TaxID=374 RepID=UPI001BAD5263|nr:iron ABC transporter substrate-binding protein [Bradyrhizobium manausense]UVO33403.1 iron ABC transporter substrate-binding protein [Bradyrhizobium arachidis]
MTMGLTRRTLLAAPSLLLGTARVRAAAVTDATGRALEIPATVARVFPAGPPAAILLYTLAPELLLGWPRANRAEECAFLLPDICARPEVGRLTGRGNTANLESVIALKPDLILDVGSTAPTFASLAARVQEQTGIPYALLDGRFDATAATYRLLGALTRRDAEPLATYAEATLTTIQGRVNRVPENERPRVYYARGPRGLETGLGGSINVETLEFLGARNVAAEQKGGLATVSVEQVLAWNPAVIVTIDRDFAANVRSDPQWAGVTAVRDGRVHLSPKLPFGWVDFPPSVNRLIGLWWLAKILYPQHFSEDMRELTRDFYWRFYHVKPSDADIDRVHAGRD